MSAAVIPVTKFFARLFRPLVRKFLLKKSEPLQARKMNDKELIARFFGERKEGRGD
jgi:hypothetical protein